MMTEEWKQLADYHERYWISNQGNLRAVYKNGKILQFKSYITKFGYRRIQLRKSNNKYKNVFVHVLVAQNFIENTDKKKYVNHKDSDRLNNNYTNLEWVTFSENIIHGFTHGFSNRKGVKNGRSKLTEKQVKEIYFSNENTKELCLKYGVKDCAIWAIKSRRLWKHIEF